MPEFFPFPGLRYRHGALDAEFGELTAPPYDVIDVEARARLEASHPMNAVHLILPRDRVPGDRYRRAAETFAAWQAEGALASDPARFYLYRMTYTDDAGDVRRMLGVVGALGLSPPGAGDVLPHERTMSKPRGDRLALLRAVRANLDPVWGLSLARGLSDLLEPHAAAAADVVCVHDGVEHCLSALPADAGAAIRHAVASAPVVIADGHHRYETALAYQAERQPENGSGAAPPGPENAIMALIVELAEEQLSVRAIHRLLIGAGPDLRTRLASCFTVTPAGANTPDGVRALAARMDAEAAMGLVDPDGLALLRVRDEVLGPDLARLPEPLHGVDSARLEVALARIGAPESLDYQPDPMLAASAVTKGAADAAVLLRAVSVAQIQAVAAAGERMPEKTTFFQPKPLTGMVFRSLDD